MIWLLLFFVLSEVYLVTSWHAYDKQKIASSSYSESQINSTCSIYNDSDQILGISRDNHFQLWPDLRYSGSDDVKSSYKTLYGFPHAIKIIYGNQHPTDCRKSKFMISHGWGGGIGSQIHVESAMFSLAVELGRVYLPNPFGPINDERANHAWHTDNSYCRSKNISTLDCYFQPWSSCNMSDVLLIDEPFNSKIHNIKHIPKINIRAFHMNNDGQLKHNIPSHVLHNMRVFIIDHAGRSNIIRFIPTPILPIVKCSPMLPYLQYYWWRAITASYFLRPNHATLDYLSSFYHTIDLKNFPIHLNHSNKVEYNSNSTNKSVVVEEEEQDKEDEGRSRTCISMYVRHGDKSKEMKLIPFTNYSNMIDILVAKRLFHIPNFFLKTKQKIPVFLGTDDKSVIAAAEKWASNSTLFKIVYTNLFDKDLFKTNINITQQNSSVSDSNNNFFRNDTGSYIRSPIKSHAIDTKYKQESYHELSYISVLLNFDLAIRCDAFICTLASNVCRVIDELRATVGGRANKPMIDLSQETCYFPPCLDGGIWNAGW